MSKLSPENDPTSIGNILVDMGVITQEKLQKLGDEFRAQREEMFGQFLVRNAGISQDQLELALIKQKQLRGEKVDMSMLLHVINISKKSHERLLNKIDGFSAIVSKVGIKS